MICEAQAYLFTSHMRISATKVKFGVLKFSIDINRGYPRALIISVKSVKCNSNYQHVYTQNTDFQLSDMMFITAGSEHHLLLKSLKDILSCEHRTGKHAPVPPLAE